VTLTESWQEVTVPRYKFRYSSQWQALWGQGGPGDRFQPGKLEAISFCFGLFSARAAEKHAVEIEGARQK
jgi:hypothetical protein